MDCPTEQFKTELLSELNAILDYWKSFGVDKKYGGFVGRRDHYNKEIEGAPKGIILNTRILWSFSAAGNFFQNKELLPYAERAYGYLKLYFKDEKYEGVYWEVDFKGNPVNKRKQIYAQAFAIYALSEFYRFLSIEEAKDWAMTLFGFIEKHARDRKYNGYLEAFDRDWSPIEDLRLSEKDRNSEKTMNTHLHVLEAYTSLLQITKHKKVREALQNLIWLFLEKFYDRKSCHFQLFYDEQWNPEGKLISYGHDIEAAWLLVEAAKAVGQKELQVETEKVAVEVANVFLREAYFPQKGVINEKEMETGEVDSDRHWWPQVEAMLGFEYVFRITGIQKYRETVLDIWNFIREHIIDAENGEWFFRIDENNHPYIHENKIGMWKCPYHNTRALIVLLNKPFS